MCRHSGNKQRFLVGEGGTCVCSDGMPNAMSDRANINERTKNEQQLKTDKNKIVNLPNGTKRKINDRKIN